MSSLLHIWFLPSLTCPLYGFLSMFFCSLTYLLPLEICTRPLFCVYQNAGKQPIWQSRSFTASPASYMMLQRDGNLVVKEGIMPGDDVTVPVRQHWRRV